MTSVTQAMEITYADQSVYLTQRPDGAWEIQDEAEERLLFVDSQMPLREVLEEAEAEAIKLRIDFLKRTRRQIEEDIVQLEQKVQEKTGLEPDPEEGGARQEEELEAREALKKSADRYIEFADGEILAETSPNHRRQWQLFDTSDRPLTDRMPADANNLPYILKHVDDNPNGDGCISTESSEVIYIGNGTFEGCGFLATETGVYPKTEDVVAELKK